MALPVPSQAPTIVPVSAVAVPISDVLLAQHLLLAPAVTTASTSVNRNALPVQRQTVRRATPVNRVPGFARTDTIHLAAPTIS